jgi:hypothetical protein
MHDSSDYSMRASIPAVGLRYSIGVYRIAVIEFGTLELWRSVRRPAVNVAAGKCNSCTAADLHWHFICSCCMYCLRLAVGVVVCAHLTALVGLGCSLLATSELLLSVGREVDRSGHASLLLYGFVVRTTLTVSLGVGSCLIGTSMQAILLVH